MIPLPFIPLQVDISDIGENGMLLSAETIEKVFTELNEQELQRHTDSHKILIRHPKKSLSSCKRYSILKDGDAIYAIYKGEKHHKLLGRGSFGRVKLIQNLKTGEWGTYKIQPTPGIIANQRYHQENQYNIEKEYNHLADLKQSCIAPENRTSDKKNELQHNFAMTFVRGKTILNIAQSQNTRYDVMPVTFWLRIIIEILRAADTLHTTHRKLHRDFKPENMIYNPANNTVTIIDFGHMVNMSPDTDSYKGYLTGSPIFTDYPLRKAYRDENLSKKTCMSIFPYSPKTELFSLAITIADLLQLLVIPVDFISFNPDESYIQDQDTLLFNSNTRIKNAALRLEMVNYLKQMTDHDPQKRPSTIEAMGYFTMLYQQELTQQPPAEIVTIHMNDWVTLTSDAKKTTIEALAKNPQVWKVCLIDSSKRNNREYNTARRLFELAGIPVTDYVLVNPAREQLNTQAKTIIPQRENDPSQPVTCRAHVFAPSLLLAAKAERAKPF